MILIEKRKEKKRKKRKRLANLEWFRGEITVSEKGHWKPRREDSPEDEIEDALSVSYK